VSKESLRRLGCADDNAIGSDQLAFYSSRSLIRVACRYSSGRDRGQLPGIKEGYGDATVLADCSRLVLSDCDVPDSLH